MPSLLKKFLICFAVLAVAVVQIFGVKAGFRCDCTGQQTVTAQCDVECHPEEVATAGNSGECSDNHGDGNTGKDQHKHKEVKQQLVSSAFPPAYALPEPLCFEVVPVFGMAEILALAEGIPVPVVHRRKPPDLRSESMPVRVARTVVMLV